MTERRTPKKAARFYRTSIRNAVRRTNLYDIEDQVMGFKKLDNAGKKSGFVAAKLAFKAGVSRTYLRSNNTIVRVSANGSEVTIGKFSGTQPAFVRYKPSTVLHVKGQSKKA